MKLRIFLLLALLLAGKLSAQDSLDVAYVKTGSGQWQIIDRTGQVLAEHLFQHDSLAVFGCNEGMAIWEREGVYGLVNLFAREKYSCRYQELTPFRGGLAAARINDQWFLVNDKGRLQPHHLSADSVDYYKADLSNEQDCKEGYCLIDTNGSANCRSPQGALLLAGSDAFVAPWNDVDAFRNNRILKYKIMANKLCSCQKLTSYYGFIDCSGNWVIEPGFEQADIFSLGLAAVSEGTENIYTYGYIGLDGSWKIAPVYQEAGRFMRVIRHR